MNKKPKVHETLNIVLSNPNFMEEVVSNEKMDYIDAITLVIKYYIATRDTNTHHSLKEIKKLFDDFLENHIEEAIENTVKHGFLTHSFNGAKKPRIEKCGLDYEGKPEFVDEINYSRDLTNKIEKILGKSNYRIDEESNNKRNNITGNTVFVCTPGKEAVGFALEYAPERLFRAPLNGVVDTIVGETKAQHYFRILEKELNRKYKRTNPKTYEEGIELAKIIVDHYCTKRPCIALIEIDKILDVPFWNRVINGSAEYYMKDVVLLRRVTDPCKDSLEHFYEDDHAGGGGGEFFNLVTQSSNIPKEAVTVIELWDSFECSQLAARKKGLKLGTKYNDDNGRKRVKADNCYLATLGEMREIVGNLHSVDDLEELKEQVAKRKAEILPKLKEPKEIIDDFGLQFNSVEELRKLYAELIEKEEKILDRPYQIRDGIKQEYSLKDAIKKFKIVGIFNGILEKDNATRMDEYQSKKSLEEIKNARILAFLISAIGHYNFLFEREIKMLLCIALNYNIGKPNEQGEVEISEDRLKGLGDFECDIVRFVINHLFSNEEEIDKYIEELRDLAIEDTFFDELEKLNIERLKSTSHDNLIPQRVIEYYKEKYFGHDPDVEINISDITKEELETIKNVAKEKLKSKINKCQYKDLARYNEVEEAIRILELFKDAYELDKVRFSPDGSDLEKGLNPERITYDKIRELEGLSYECYDKLIELLDIEHLKKAIEQYLELGEELLNGDEIEAEINRQIEECRIASSNCVDKLVEESVSKVNIQNLSGSINEHFDSSRKKPKKRNKLYEK